MVALKGKPDIGDRINTQIVHPLIEANERLARTDFPDFNASAFAKASPDKSVCAGCSDRL